METPIPLHLVMAGGASLGSFHGGALAALLSGLRRPAAEGAVRLDAVGGTSAGAIAALLAAHAWLEGVDPAWLMYEAWVEQLSTDLLRSRREPAPFSFERLRADLDVVLDPHEDGEPVHRVAAATSPLVLHANLLNLHGLPYDLPGNGDTRGTTYDDWAQFVLRPGGGPEQLRTPEGGSPLDAVLASAANPAAFGPIALDRSPDLQQYRANGIVDLPESGIFWYSDGGPLTNEPVGRVVMAGAAVRDQEDGRKVALVLDPRSEGPTDTAFTGDHQRPSWLSALKRTLSLVPAQAISDDLRHIGKHNQRLRMVQGLHDELEGQVSEESLARLRELVNDVRADGTGTSEPLPEDSDLSRLLSAIAGVDGKSELVCDLISPRLLGEGHTAEYLAGELMGDFGGFLDRSLRHNDFLLGFDCATEWFDQRITDVGLDEELAAAAREDLQAARPEGEIDPALSTARMRSTLPGSAIATGRIVGSAVAGIARRLLPLP